MPKKILFVSAYKTSFVKKDYEILNQYFKVDTLFLTKKYSKVNKLLVHFVKILLKITKNEIIFVWFADYRAFLAVLLAKILKKKTVIVVGGYELADLPEFNYGGLRSLFAKKRLKFTLKNADKVLTVDESLKYEIINKLFLKADNVTTLPTGYDSDKFVSNQPKEKLVITVAAVKKLNSLRIKGLDIFIEVAAELPEYDFMIIGCQGEAYEWLEKKSSSNVKIKQYLPQSELINFYKKARVYCQLSIREGLPNALCEAMLCKCVPIGTRTHGIPKAIGKTGFLTDYNDFKAIKHAIVKAISSNRGDLARNRIIKLFNLGTRTTDLIKVINEL